MQGPLLGLEVNVTTVNATGNTTTNQYPDMENSCWFLVGVGAFATVLLMLMQTEYRRQNFDNDSSKTRNDNTVLASR